MVFVTCKCGLILDEKDRIIRDTFTVYIFKCKECYFRITLVNDGKKNMFNCDCGYEMHWNCVSYKDGNPINHFKCINCFSEVLLQN